MATLPFPPRFRFQPDDEPWRHRPAEYAGAPGIPWGWYQDGRRLRHVKASKAFIWPKDGKNGSTWGRVKDLLQNKGPDIYVAFGANKADCVSNRPTRAQWSKHTNLDDADLKHEFSAKIHAPWTKNSSLGGRPSYRSYDFRTRRYRTPHDKMWTDAVWQQEPYKNRKWNLYPEAVRDINGNWWQDQQYVPQFLGGPVSNEYGQGFPGLHLSGAAMR